MISTEQGASELAHDGDFAAQMFGHRLQSSSGKMDHRHRILDGNLLLPSRLEVEVGAAEGGEDECGSSVDHVAAVEFRRDLHRQCAVA